MTRSHHNTKTSFSAPLVRIAFVALLLVGSAAAQMFPPQEGDMVARVPFAFAVDGVESPAGEYLLRVNDDGSILLCEDGVYCNTMRNAPSRAAGPKAALIFTDTPKGPRLAGIGGPDMASCDDLRTVDARPLRLERHEGLQLAATWR